MDFMEQSSLDQNQINEAQELLQDKFETFILQYIEETESFLCEIDICRSGNNNNSITEIVHQLKSSSFQAGAKDVSNLCAAIQSFLNTHRDSLSETAFQTQLQRYITDLHHRFQIYKKAIFQ